MTYPTRGRGIGRKPAWMLDRRRVGGDSTAAIHAGEVPCPSRQASHARVLEVLACPAAQARRGAGRRGWGGPRAAAGAAPKFLGGPLWLTPRN